MDFDFACTMCGKCCHDLRLPLTVAEALAWLERGNDVQLLCDAVPWPEELPADNLQAAHKRRRSFGAMSGSLPVRVVVILAGAFEGACPNLQPDMRCGIYEERPLVCRIYPAEISPFIALDTQHKACPTEAWAQGLPPLLRAGKLVDEHTLALVQRSRDADGSDVPVKRRLCEALGIDRAALSNEGFAVHSPDRTTLLAALRAASRDDASSAASPAWHVVSNRRATVETLAAVGAQGSLVDGNSATAFEYIGFFAAAE